MLISLYPFWDVVSISLSIDFCITLSLFSSDFVNFHIAYLYAVVKQ